MMRQQTKYRNLFRLYVGAQEAVRFERILRNENVDFIVQGEASGSEGRVFSFHHSAISEVNTIVKEYEVVIGRRDHKLIPSNEVRPTKMSVSAAVLAVVLTYIVMVMAR